MIQKTRGRINDFLSIDDLRKGNVSQRRNPLIADLFRRIEMVEAWGRGIPLILEKEPDVEFKEVATLFIASFGRPSFKNAGEVGKEKVQKTIQYKHEATKETLKKHQRTPKEKILAVISAQPSISIREAAVQCEMSFYSIQHHINKLKKAGVIRHVGPTKAEHWEVLKGRSDGSGSSEVEGDND